MRRINAFLYPEDYQQTIQTDIQQVIEYNNEIIRFQAEAQAIEEMAGYIRTRYEVDKLFFSITPYDRFAVYVQGDHIEHEGVFYVAVVDVAAQSTVIIEEEKPAPIYNPATTYDVNTFVSYMGKTYECDQTNTINIPPSDEDRWTIIAPQIWYQIDERNPLLVMYACDIALYHLHGRISPRQIPDLRISRYERAIEWLEDVRKGNVNLSTDLYVDSLVVVEEIEEPSTENNQLIGYGSRFESRNNYW